MSHGRLQKHFGDVIRDLRAESGISQEVLADQSGLHRTYISLLERGLRNPSLEVIFQLAAALKVPPSRLLDLTEKKSLKRK